MLGLSGGELFLVVFVTVAVVSAPWWARLGGALGEMLARGRGGSERRDDGKASGE